MNWVGGSNTSDSTEVTVFKAPLEAPIIEFDNFAVGVVEHTERFEKKVSHQLLRIASSPQLPRTNRASMTGTIHA